MSLCSIKKHKDTKEQRFFLDTKITSDLKVATKPCGRGSPPAPLIPPRGTCIADEKLCGLCKAALAALCIFRSRKRHSLFVSLCLKIKTRKSPAPLNPPRGTCIAAEKLCVLCQAALAALCIFRTRKKSQCLSVSVFKIKKLSVFNNR